MITKNPSRTKTTESTISDHFTALLVIPKQISPFPKHGSIFRLQELENIGRTWSYEFSFSVGSKAEESTKRYICR